MSHPEIFQAASCFHFLFVGMESGRKAEEVGQGRPLVIEVAQRLVSYVTSRRLNEDLSAAVLILKGSASRLTVLPKRRPAMPERTTYLRGAMER